jgi:hypothetical protein
MKLEGHIQANGATNNEHNEHSLWHADIMRLLYWSAAAIHPFPGNDEQII